MYGPSLPSSILDQDEISWGDKLTHIRATTEDSFLQDYYKLAADRFDERFQAILDTFPNDHEERNEMISEILSNLNEIYKNVDNNYVEELNKSFRSFAHQIAEASGGFLGFGAESFQEHQWVDLAMLKK